MLIDSLLKNLELKNQKIKNIKKNIIIAQRYISKK